VVPLAWIVAVRSLRTRRTFEIERCPVRPEFSKAFALPLSSLPRVLINSVGKFPQQAAGRRSAGGPLK
jgi:hypothetical protein